MAYGDAYSGEDEDPISLPADPDTTIRPNLMGFGGFNLGFDPAQGGAPVRTGSTAPTPGVDPRVKMFANILALLMAGGGLAGVGQELFGSPGHTTVTPRLSPQALQMFGGAQQQFGETGNMLQALMGALQNPQIPPQLSLLTEQAFQPQLGNLYQQAAEAGRRRGFHDAPGTSPPGGAILGPGLADLQGQMAQAKLNLYQNNIANILAAAQGSQRLAQGQGQIATNLPFGRRTEEPSPSILDVMKGVSPIIGGIGSILGAAYPPPTPPVPSWVGSLMASLSGSPTG